MTGDDETPPTFGEIAAHVAAEVERFKAALRARPQLLASLDAALEARGGTLHPPSHPPATGASLQGEAAGKGRATVAGHATALHGGEEERKVAPLPSGVPPPSGGEWSGPPSGGEDHRVRGDEDTTASPPPTQLRAGPRATSLFVPR